MNLLTLTVRKEGATSYATPVKRTVDTNVIKQIKDDVLNGSGSIVFYFSEHVREVRELYVLESQADILLNAITLIPVSILTIDGVSNAINATINCINAINSIVANGTGSTINYREGDHNHATVKIIEVSNSMASIQQLLLVAELAASKGTAPNYNIVAVNQGAKVFSINGDHASSYPTGTTIIVTGGANAGSYVVDTAGSVFDGLLTNITVVAAIPSATVAGYVHL